MPPEKIFMWSASRGGLSSPGLQPEGAMMPSCSLSIWTLKFDDVSRMRLPSSVSIWTLNFNPKD